ncbi:enoyl-CoA hydratase/isomerase family protein [Oceanicola sp. 502str15]|uniref:enoyl-CoA hydratase/isomerase family protein n=1 Tax=Oceanicola sp. 502str15 TaxID=2696061 RepID=UPI0020961BBA|nr:enoyl-CoA hydratase/isomerase family protein [Oceanicola sp. 502str15]MCO6384436.1 enoyl-CoA hydratase/isomerase family protein [Oceanicola sp. 502str15]
MIRVADEGGLRTVTIDRPEKANSLTGDMLEALVEAVTEFDGGALVLTGAGKVFSAGADLDEAKAGLATSPLWERLSHAVAESDALTVAALNGTLAGGAFGMALACDLRIAVPGAKFFYPVMKLGYLPQPSDPARLSALVGRGRARMILLAAQKIGAEEAVAWGLVDRLVEPEALTGEAAALCAAAMAAEPKVRAGIKAMCRGMTVPGVTSAAGDLPS